MIRIYFILVTFFTLNKYITIAGEYVYMLNKKDNAKIKIRQKNTILKNNSRQIDAFSNEFVEPLY